jgi:pyruvate/2-oxoglutarate dehydrogenase complex dihydrolipoamide acyltransferase (E2) component
MSGIFLQSGSHPNLKAGGCVMEFAAWVAGEPHSDHPKCVSPVIGAFMRRLNDRLSDERRQVLVPYAIAVIGTNTGRADDVTRAYLCADWACRTVAPWWMERAGLHATALRALPEVVDRATALAARARCRTAHADAAAYADAAADAYAYAAAAADAAAYADAAAAAAAAADAAADAAAAAAAAAYAAAAADAAAALMPSALALVDRMIAVGRAPERTIHEDRRAVVCAV